MRVASIDCHVVLRPDLNAGATSSTQDDIVVEDPLEIERPRGEPNAGSEPPPSRPHL